MSAQQPRSQGAGAGSRATSSKGPFQQQPQVPQPIEVPQLSAEKQQEMNAAYQQLMEHGEVRTFHRGNKSIRTQNLAETCGFLIICK